MQKRQPGSVTSIALCAIDLMHEFKYRFQNERMLDSAHLELLL